MPSASPRTPRNGTSSADVKARGDLDSDALVDLLCGDAEQAYQSREEQLGAPVLRELERKIVLSVLDRRWREHLYEMEYLQEGIGLRAMAQRDPLVEYQREGFDLFSAMMDAMKEEVVGFIFNIDVQVEAVSEEQPAVEVKGFGAPRAQNLTYVAPGEDGSQRVEQQTGSRERQVGRNEPCPCGSGKKYKRCHGGGGN